MDSGPDFEAQQPSSESSTNNLRLPRLRDNSLSQYTREPLSDGLREP